MDNLSKSDVKNIVKDELDKFAKNELDIELGKLIKNSNSKGRNEILKITKDALAAFAKYMWIRKTLWQSDIR